MLDMVGAMVSLAYLAVLGYCDGKIGQHLFSHRVTSDIVKEG